MIERIAAQIQKLSQRFQMLNQVRNQPDKDKFKKKNFQIKLLKLKILFKNKNLINCNLKKFSNLLKMENNKISNYIN